MLWFPDVQTICFNKIVELWLSKIANLTGKLLLVLYFVLFFILESLLLQGSVDQQHIQFVPCQSKINADEKNESASLCIDYSHGVFLPYITKLLLFLELTAILYSAISFKDSETNPISWDETLNLETTEYLATDNKMHNSNKRIESIGCPLKDENQFRGLLKNSIFSFAIRKGKGLLQPNSNIK